MLLIIPLAQSGGNYGAIGKGFLRDARARPQSKTGFAKAHGVADKIALSRRSLIRRLPPPDLQAPAPSLKQLAG
jgi:hypothetical protein